MTNIILIGFKSSGKTTLGKKIAEMSGRHFIDTDSLIKVSYLDSPAMFRQMEKEVIAALQEFHSCVIATGGGVVLDPDNVAILKKMGKIVYLQVEKEELKRRLLSGRLPGFLDPLRPAESFEEMYQARVGIYESIADQIWTYSQELSIITSHGKQLVR